MNSMDDYDFRVPGLVLTLGKSMHYVLHAKWSEQVVKRRNILSRREITHNFRQNCRMLTILEILCLFLR